MNPTESTPPATPVEATAPLTARSDRPLPLLAFLAALAAILTALLGGFAVQEVVPAEWAAYTGLVSLGLFGLRAGIIAAGDMLDDGIMNGSFKGNVAPLITCVLVCLSLASCAMSGQQREDLARRSAKGALIAGVNPPPDTPWWQAALAGALHPLLQASGLLGPQPMVEVPVPTPAPELTSGK